MAETVQFDPSRPLKNPRWERFAQALAEGKSATESYAEAGYSPNQGNSSLLKSNQMVSERLDFLLDFTLAEGRRYLADILRTPIGKIDADHPLCQELTRVEGAEFSSTKIKMPGKLDAFDKMAKLKGWYAPEKSEIKHEAFDPEVRTALRKSMGLE